MDNLSECAKPHKCDISKKKSSGDMCRIMEDMRNETELATRIDNALEMIKGGKLSLEDIAQYSGLSIEKVRELAEGKTA